MHVRDKYRHFNYENTFDLILDDFRAGNLGNITLDDISELTEWNFQQNVY